MRQQFFTDTIQSRFIKDLIYTTPIPTYNTVNKGDMIYENQIYIYRSNIIKCNTRGILGNGAKYTKIADFVFGRHYPKFTERYSSNSYYYDSKTHEWLGKLLRCYRDINDINLMPFYNCFTEDYQSGVRITDTEILNTVYANYRMLKVPVKFNRSYTIAIDCDSEVYIAPAIISNNNFSKVTVDSGAIDLTSLLFNDNIRKYNSLSFKQPILYTVNNQSEARVTELTYSSKNGDYSPTVTDFLYTYENQLYLLIQLPDDNHSSICILEGDYRDLDGRRIFNYEDISKITEKELNEIFLSNLSLLQFSDKFDYPFADRLIEFLLWNVINQNDPITDNVERVQDKLLLRNYYPSSIKGVWDTELRRILYDLYMSNNRYEKLDITGFVDKDVENYLRRQL